MRGIAPATHSLGEPGIVFPLYVTRVLSSSPRTKSPIFHIRHNSYVIDLYFLPCTARALQHGFLIILQVG